MNPLEDEFIQNNFIRNNENAYFFYNIYFGLRAKHFIGSEPYIPKIFWNSNYWDEPRLQSYFIHGFITFFSFNFFIRYFFRFYMNGSKLELVPYPINWFNIDKNPAKEPYDIPIIVWRETIDIWIKEGLAITKIGISFKPVFANDTILPEKN